MTPCLRQNAGVGFWLTSSVVRDAMPKFREKLLAPLRDERRGDEHERPADKSSEHVLLEQHARLDRLPEAHLVGEQDPSPEVLQDLPDSLDLIPVHGRSGDDRGKSTRRTRSSTRGGQDQAWRDSSPGGRGPNRGFFANSSIGAECKPALDGGYYVAVCSSIIAID